MVRRLYTPRHILNLPRQQVVPAGGGIALSDSAGGGIAFPDFTGGRWAGQKELEFDMNGCVDIKKIEWRLGVSGH